MATADWQSGTPCLAPFSFLWDGECLLFAMPAASQTGRNLQTLDSVRLGIGQTRDVVLIEGSIEVLASAEISDDVATAFAAKTRFDPRRLTGNYFDFRIRPWKPQAWRGVNELTRRDLRRDGHWLAPETSRGAAAALIRERPRSEYRAPGDSSPCARQESLGE